MKDYWLLWTSVLYLELCTVHVHGVIVTRPLLPNKEVVINEEVVVSVHLPHNYSYLSLMDDNQCERTAPRDAINYYYYY